MWSRMRHTVYVYHHSVLQSVVLRRVYNSAAISLRIVPPYFRWRSCPPPYGEKLFTSAHDEPHPNFINKFIKGYYYQIDRWIEWKKTGTEVTIIKPSVPQVRILSHARKKMIKENDKSCDEKKKKERCNTSIHETDMSLASNMYILLLLYFLVKTMYSYPPTCCRLCTKQNFEGYTDTETL